MREQRHPVYNNITNSEEEDKKKRGEGEGAGFLRFFLAARIFREKKGLGALISFSLSLAL